jgi:1,4-alpha-glucan branching enzyme
VFNYGRNEVRSLISNALFWLQIIMRTDFDAVASMLYLDYSRNEGNGSLIFMVEGKPGYHQFLKEFNEAVYSNFEGFKQLLKKVLHFLWFLDQPLLVVWGLG